MKTVLRRRLDFIVGFVVYFGALWFLWDTIAVYPLKIFVVLLHEVSHAVALLLTGGSVHRITLDPYQGGATFGAGGSSFLVLSAGYLGSLAWGTLLVRASKARRPRPELTVGFVGIVVVALSLLYVRNLFGLGFGLLFGVVLFGISRRLPSLWNARLLMVLGLTSCLYAVLDIKSDVIDRPGLQSDAAMLAQVTGVPTVVWGVLWIGTAIAVCALLFRWAWRRA